MLAKRTISFDEASHTYRDEFKKEYVSVTTLIERYCPKFDREFWAIKKAQDLNTTPELIKASWDEITKHSQDKGNREHKLLEDSINLSNNNAKFDYEGKTNPKLGLGMISINKTNLHVLQNSPLAQKYPKIYQFLKGYIEDGWTLYAERRVYLAEYLVAGTIDCLLVKNKFFMIVDWKTNKDKLMFKSGYFKKVGGIKTNTWVDKKEYMYDILSRVEHCKGMKYTIQLSLYAKILEMWGYKCTGLFLFHIPNEIDITNFPITYLHQDCLNLLNHFKSGLPINKNINKNPNYGSNFGIF